MYVFIHTLHAACVCVYTYAACGVCGKAGRAGAGFVFVASLKTKNIKKK
jgi:hypothetical protein